MNALKLATMARGVLFSPAAQLSPFWLSMTLRRIARHLFTRVRGHTTISNFDNSYVLTLDLREHMQSRIFWLGYYNLDIVAVLNNVLKAGMTVIDVGANIGEISMVSAKRVGPVGRVIAFEPLHTIADSLERNIANNNLSCISVIRHGASDHTGDARIYLKPNTIGDEAPNTGLGTLYPQEAESVDNSAEWIKLARLDDLPEIRSLDRIDLIKIDIEGAELACLRGARNTIEQHRPILIVEVQRDSCERAGYDQNDILVLLTEFGYNFYRIGRHGKASMISIDDLEDFQNVLCVPTDSSPYTVRNAGSMPQ